MDIIMDYSFDLIHCPGIRNILPDVLSRIHSKNSGEDGEQAVEFVHRRKHVNPMFEAVSIGLDTKTDGSVCSHASSDSLCRAEKIGEEIITDSDLHQRRIEANLDSPVRRIEASQDFECLTEGTIVESNDSVEIEADRGRSSGSCSETSSSNERTTTTTTMTTAVIHRANIHVLYPNLHLLDEIEWQQPRALSPPMSSDDRGNQRGRLPDPLRSAISSMFPNITCYGPCDNELAIQTPWSGSVLLFSVCNEESIRSSIKKCLDEVERHGKICLLLLPKWSTKRWYQILSSLTDLYVFRKPIRLEPFRNAPKYKSTLFFVPQSRVKKLRRAFLREHYLLPLQDKATRETIEDSDRRLECIDQHHSMGHFGTMAIFRSINTQGYRWPNMMHDIAKRISQCQECQRHVIAHEGFHPMQSVRAELPMDHVAFDLKHMDTSMDGKNYVLVVIDVCTRFVFFRALVTASAREVAKELFLLFSDFGFPKILQSDNGPEFRNELLDSLSKLMQASHRFTTPYHPRGNGIAEAAVKKLKSVIRKLTKGSTTEWTRFLASAQYMCNLKVSSVHKSTPFSLFFARRANALSNYSSTEERPLSKDELEGRLQYMTKLVFPSINELTDKTQAIWKDDFDGKANLIALPEGSMVMTVVERRSGMEPEYEGPFKVMRRSRAGTYTLMDSDGKLLSRNYAPSQLKLIKAPEQFFETYQVEKIVDFRKSAEHPGVNEFLVKWKGYSDEHNSWEPESNFHDVQVITRFMEQMRQLGRITLDHDTA